MNVAYNMDCMEYMRTVPDKYFDLAVVDPPYGINVTGTIGGGGAFGGKKAEIKGAKVVMPKNYHSFDDTKPPNADYFNELERVSKELIIWGGNYFLDNLPKTSCLII